MKTSVLQEDLIKNMLEKQEQQIRQKDSELIRPGKAHEKELMAEAKKSEAIRECEALYGKPEELIIDRTLLHTVNGADTVIMLYAKTAGKMVSSAQRQIDPWLKAKFTVRKAKIIIR